MTKNTLHLVTQTISFGCFARGNKAAGMKLTFNSGIQEWKDSINWNTAGSFLIVAMTQVDFINLLD